MTRLLYRLALLTLVGVAGTPGVGCSDATEADPATLLGDCQRPSGAEQAHRVVFSERYGCPPPGVPQATVVTDEAAWVAMADHLSGCSTGGTTVDPVDLATEYVIVLGASAFQTCGFDFDGVVVRHGDDGPYAELEVTDRSGGCDIQCAMGGGYVVAIAVPRTAGESPTLCRRVNPGCP